MRTACSLDEIGSVWARLIEPVPTIMIQCSFARSILAARASLADDRRESFETNSPDTAANDDDHPISHQACLSTRASSTQNSPFTM